MSYFILFFYSFMVLKHVVPKVPTDPYILHLNGRGRTGLGLANADDFIYKLTITAPFDKLNNYVIFNPC